MGQAPDASAITQLQLLPAGVMAMVHPPHAADEVLGLDVFAHPGRRADALRVAEGGIMTVEGPYRLVEGGFAAGVCDPPGRRARRGIPVALLTASFQHGL